MSVKSRDAVLPKAVIAALVGSIAGGLAGIWSLPRPVASVNAAAPVSPAAPPMATSSAQKPVTLAPEPALARTNAAAPTADDANVLQRAQTLARRPDVMALIALRADVVQRATEGGILPQVKSQLDEIDLRLNEARVLQLKLDAEAFRKAASQSAR
jgi:hypothetical protein